MVGRSKRNMALPIHWNVDSDEKLVDSMAISNKTRSSSMMLASMGH